MVSAGETETQRETHWALEQLGLVILSQHSQASLNICME